MAEKNFLRSTGKSILVSACLLGLPTRYDGKTKRSERVLQFLKENDLQPIPVCPEQLAGLSTPREKTFFKQGDGFDVLDSKGLAVSVKGTEMNDIFSQGAKMTLHIAQLCNCDQALLKERSPSCGVHQVYLEEEQVEGSGVTAAILIREGIHVFSEEDI